jgi:hypothetical protein
MDGVWDVLMLGHHFLSFSYYRIQGDNRKERLPLYLAEYVWRYNHRNDNIENQKILILKQLESQHL